MKRIVVTGLGVVSPIGNNVQDFWASLLAGKSGIGPLTKLDSSLYKRTPLVSEVKDFQFDSTQYNGIELDERGDAIRYALTATAEALQDGALKVGQNIAPEDIGVIIGTTYGTQDLMLRAIKELDMDKEEAEWSIGESPLLSNLRTSDMTASVAKAFDLGGPNINLPLACSAGNYAVSIGHQLIQQSKAKAVVVGGADAITFHGYNIFYRSAIMSHEGCYPFDKNRSGMIVGEGCGMLLLEDYDHAKARGAEIYGEITGYGINGDAYDQIGLDPKGTGAIYTIKQALKMSKLNPEDITYISPHGTATPTNDFYEAVAFAETFSETLKSKPFIALKSMLGHCMSAASAFEAVASLLSIKEDTVPETINHHTDDDSFPIPFSLKLNGNGQANHKVEHVISNSAAVGGNICTIVMSKAAN